MFRKPLLPLVLITAFAWPLSAQRENGALEVEVVNMQSTPMGVSLTLQAMEAPDALHMVIGVTEGQAIIRALRRQKPPRPQTHDLLKLFLDRNGWSVQRVLIRDLVENAYIADLTLEKDGETQVYDCRPSDALAIGLRYGAKIYVAPEVFELQRESEQEQQLERPAESDTLRL